jgi:SAM-dependent methyltransferase
MSKWTYNPEIFEAKSLDHAKAIILTPEPGQDTDSRWLRETPYLGQLLGEAMELKPGQLVIDYGCGVGRMAKELIERWDVRVLGVDISREMRSLAPAYVDKSVFSAVSRAMLETLAAGGLRADAAIAVWVLQHCPYPAQDLGLLRGALKPGGRIGVANTNVRLVPTKERVWASDGLNLREMLNANFPLIADGALDPEIVGAFIAERTYWSVHTAGPAET